MPIGVFKYVRDVSSEDSVHVAANLLQNNGNKKWKTKANAGDSAYVILEFEEPLRITGINIGNEHSFSVKVMVSKTGCQADDFKLKLLGSSFMTASESINSRNINREQWFNSEALDVTARPDKWKFVKIVCTQPFNNRVKYGLSFIKVHVAAATQPNSSVPDKCKLKSLSKSVLGTTAVIRDAGSPATLRRLIDTIQAPIELNSSAYYLTSSVTRKSDTKPVDRNQDSLMFGGNNTDAKTQNGVQPRKKSNRVGLENELDKDKKSYKDKQESINKTSTPEVIIESPTPKPDCAKRRLFVSKDDPDKSANKAKSNIKNVPFDQLLKGVVFVISGIQNPDRADLRSKALAMGAEYKDTWEPDCTHLICALRNTSKYNQIKSEGKGKIVNTIWIEKCYKLRKYLPWRRYALDMVDFDKPESDEELHDINHKSH